MANSLIIDNWTLQDVEKLLSDGIESTRVGEIVIETGRQKHRFEPVNMGVIQIDALLTLLTNVVCYEQLLVDKDFVQAWQRHTGNLSPLSNRAVLIPIDYTAMGDQLHELRGALVGELCVVPTLTAEMNRIQESWERTRTSPDPHMSALVWGGAGMLARSHLSGHAYFGHPFRRKLIRETRMFAPRESAVERLNSFLDTGRSKMFRYRGAQLSGTVGEIVLPPIPVQIIEEATSLKDLIPVALQMRDKNGRLREWLAEYQTALDQEDERKQLKFEKVLVSIARSLETTYGASKGGSIGLSVSAAWFKFDIPKTLLDKVMNSVGIRATLTNFLLSPRGRRAVSKLLKMLDVGHTTLGREIEAIFRLRYAPEPPASDT